MTIMSWATEAKATTARYMSLRELVKAADTVVYGRVTQRDSFWLDRSRIYTLVHVDVAEVWAGQAVPSHGVDVLTPGGVVGTIGQRVDGAAQFSDGGACVLQLQSTPTGEYIPVAMAQGVWHVAQSQTGNLTVIRPHVDRLVGSPTDVSAAPTTLVELKQAIMEAARAP